MDQSEDQLREPIALSWGYAPFLAAGFAIKFLIFFASGWLIAPVFSLFLGLGSAAERVYKHGFSGGRNWAVVSIIASIAAYFAAIPFHN